MRVHDTGWVEFNGAVFQAALPLIQVGVVQWILRRFGRNAGFAKAERALPALDGLGRGRFVLAGVVFSCGPQGQIVCWREVERSPLEVLHRSFSVNDLLWDQRVRLGFHELGDQTFVVRAFDALEGGLVRRYFKDVGQDLPFPPEVLLSLVTIWTDEAVPRLVKVPQIKDKKLERLILTALSGEMLPNGQIEARLLRLFPDDMGGEATDL